MASRKLSWMVAILGVLSTLGVACGPAEPGVLDSPCAVLSDIHTSRGTEISGNASIGGLDSYGFGLNDQGEIKITPAQTTPCGQEIAGKLQAICPTCEVQGGAACQDLTENIFNTPTEACAVCGDLICSPGEGVDKCPSDCGSVCGDDICSPDEGVDTCPADCGGTCGNGTCEGGESPQDCPQDCEVTCGNGSCSNGETGLLLDPLNPPALFCPMDCSSCHHYENGVSVPGDGYCTLFENAVTCAADCAKCGDGICSDPLETAAVCAVDCAGVCVVDGTCDAAGGEEAANCPFDCDTCGNDFCAANEDVGSCASDCTICGDSVCAGGELPTTCARDCFCGDGVCSTTEDATACPADCT